jgi:deoxyribonuclease V
MQIRRLHRWDLNYQEAIALQKQMASLVSLEPLPRKPKIVAGVDVSYEKESELAFAAAVVLRLPDLVEIDSAAVEARCTFPYVPGLLSFREAPIIVQALRKIRYRPDVIMVDGQGIAHPRRFGIASHLGIVTELPTVGCAKSRLAGEYRSEPADVVGGYATLRIDGAPVGTVLRTKPGTKPLFVSPGNMVSMEDAVNVVLRTLDKFRVPEPTRRAHLLVSKLRADHRAGRAAPVVAAPSAKRKTKTAAGKKAKAKARPRSRKKKK